MKVDEYFGINVFDDQVMQKRLPKDIYKKLKKIVDSRESLTIEVADVVANAMKDWAIEKGATHYCHWFQPMTGRTAEKHDSFIEPQRFGGIVMEFSGKQLIQGEPDASSFPNGGLRATFEARGYTAWDATSPAFIRDTTLYIPTAFCSYTGAALDKKTPLLRSMDAINKQAMRVLRLLGDTRSEKIATTVGAEQEYFLIDKRLYQQRKDLILTGRTLFGAAAPKGQEMEDHYFGSIKENIAAFMKEIDEELWKLGVASKTKHNEVAPGQHELALIYTTTNIATDHNQLVMDTLVKVANHHQLVCLLHPKPFEGVNGSGKHNNWSISTESYNLLEPGQTPHKNRQFLLFLSAIIAAVDEYAPLLYMSAASAANEHRLGGNEAPPTIISIFLGEQLSQIASQIENQWKKSSTKADQLILNVSTLPYLSRDVTDRNRTSPFAFTGNKFEFRMCSSAASVADPNIILNTIVAEHLKRAAERLEQTDNVDAEVEAIITDNIKQHSRVIFDGDGYSEEWKTEAIRRGLPQIQSTVEAIKEFPKEYSVKLFESHGVLSRHEIDARTEIQLEDYYKTLNIEALTMISMVRQQILPAVLEDSGEMAEKINQLQKLNQQVPDYYEESLTEIMNLANQASGVLRGMETCLQEASKIKNSLEKATYYRDVIFPAMGDLRRPCDQLEELISQSKWPFPTYMDLLFRV